MNDSDKMGKDKFISRPPSLESWDGGMHHCVEETQMVERIIMEKWGREMRMGKPENRNEEMRNGEMERRNGEYEMRNGEMRKTQ
ncbi:hypothetical protein TNCV_283111 [Trichonephila clavipes]|nr:hypothetical protein TNCV_283111 [Trichonephila clavipes]